MARQAQVMQRLRPLSVILASLVLVTMLVLVIFAPMIAPDGSARRLVLAST